MKSILMIMLNILLLSINCMATGENKITGTRAAGMAFTSVAISDEWSAFNNPGGLGNMKNLIAGICFENRFMMKETSLKSLTVIIPAWNGSFGLVFRHYGFSLYQEIKGGIAYGMQIGNRFFFGVQLNCHRIGQAEGYGNAYFASFEAGIQFRANDHLRFGARLVNPVEYKFSTAFSGRLPASITIGLLWQISRSLLTTLEIEKDLINSPVIRAGLEYLVAKKLFLRTGILTNPVSFTLGAGVEFGPVKFDIASAYHPVLGYSPQASLIYRFKSKE